MGVPSGAVRDPAMLARLRGPSAPRLLLNSSTSVPFSQLSNGVRCLEPHRGVRGDGCDTELSCCRPLASSRRFIHDPGRLGVFVDFDRGIAGPVLFRGSPPPLRDPKAREVAFPTQYPREFLF